MAYDGWIEFGGQELINLSRTAQLAETLGIDTLWTTPDDVAWIEAARGGAGYDLIEMAPWYDEGHPASAEFAGIVPLSIAGLDDSTTESTTVEYITDGGSSGKARNKTLPIVANVAILASTTRGAEFGKRWLDRMLRTSDGTHCGGSDMRYYRYVQADGLPVPEIAHRRNVTLSRGVSVTRKRENHCSATWMATFTWTANDPFEYGEPVVALTGLGGTDITGEGVVVAETINLVNDPSFGNVSAYWAPFRGTFAVVTGTPGTTTTVSGNTAGEWTATVAGGQGGVNGGYIPVVAGQRYSAQAQVKRSGPVATEYKVMVRLFDAGGTILDERFTGYPSGSVSDTDFSYFTLSNILAPAGAVNAMVLVVVDNPAIGTKFRLDAVQFTNTTAAGAYFDGDTADTASTVYEWVGTPQDSASRKRVLPAGIAGVLSLSEQECPVYDYTPIYDPMRPALVAAPTAPDFYPDGWDFLPGVAYTRFWVRIPPIEPSVLTMVPVVTLTSDFEARMVRVSIWSAQEAEYAFCDPLWTATVSYLPPSLDFVIDGEQKVAYVWDGASPVVRRSDSLVFGPGARPIQWESFNDPDGLLVTLDIMTSDYDGDGTVRAALSLVPKSD